MTQRHIASLIVASALLVPIAVGAQTFKEKPKVPNKLSISLNPALAIEK